MTTPQPHHLRRQGIKQHFIPKERYKAMRYRDAIIILGHEKTIRDLKSKLAEYER